MIEVPRLRLIGLGALFSAYSLVLAISTLHIPRDIGPVILAMVLYSLAVVASLARAAKGPMSVWLALGNIAVSQAILILCTLQLDPAADNGYATWFIGAGGVLMTITLTRQRVLLAWIGTISLVCAVMVWVGPAATITSGVVGSIMWVTVAHLIRRGLSRAERNIEAFDAAEREASQWQAAQDAHLQERQRRLEKTADVARPMLQRIVQEEGRLDEAERRECQVLEASIRDEIRGRRLLDDAMREQVRAARDRGVLVTLLDEGGLDELPEDMVREVLAEVSSAIAAFDGDRLIVRTAPGAEVAVSVVGLARDVDAVGIDDEDDEVRLWLQVPYPRGSRPVLLGDRGDYQI